MKYKLKESFFGKYTLYVEEKYLDGSDPYNTRYIKHIRKATKEERKQFYIYMNNRRVCDVLREIY